MNSCITRPKQTRLRSRTLLGVAATGLALAAAMAAVQADVGSKKWKPGIAELKQTGAAFSQVAKKAAPAVVFVKVEKSHAAPHAARMPSERLPGPFQDDELLKRFFGDRLPKFEMPETPRHSSGHGSGFVINKDGYILTNAHVVDGADHVEVTMSDGREFEAKIIGTDSRSDVAVIKIDAKNLATLPMGNSDDIEVGEWVLAVGSPFGLSGTVTSGIVSAKGRSSVGIADYENFIQTDAAINPGNSGGPLLNLDGEAVGINTAIFSRSGGYMGIGFAIPINMARDICDQLITDGSVTRGFLGVAIQELTPELAASFGLDDTDGVLVSDVTKDSPADKAGLKTGDVIVEFNGTDAKNVGPLRNAVAHSTPDNKVKMVVMRDGERKQLRVTIGTLPAKGQLSHATGGNDVDALGLTVQPLSDEMRERFGFQEEAGVVVAGVQSGSKAALAGIEPGMLIKEVNRQSINSLDEFTEAMKAAADDDSVLFLVKKGQYSRYVPVELN